MTTIQAQSVGEFVKVVGATKDPIRGIVTAISIRGEPSDSHITYEVEWWDGRSRKDGWFPARQVKPERDAVTRIGFGGAEKSLEFRLQKVLGFLATVRRENTSEWMHNAERVLNQELEAFGDRDRARLSHDGTGFDVVKG